MSNAERLVMIPLAPHTNRERDRQTETGTLSERQSGIEKESGSQRERSRHM